MVSKRFYVQSLRFRRPVSARSAKRSMAGKSQVDKLVLHLVATICTLSIVELASSTSDRGFARKLTYSGRLTPQCTAK